MSTTTPTAAAAGSALRKVTPFEPPPHSATRRPSRRAPSSSLRHSACWRARLSSKLAISRSTSAPVVRRRSAVAAQPGLEEQVLVVEPGAQIEQREAAGAEQPAERAQREIATVLVVDVPEGAFGEDPRGCPGPRRTAVGGSGSSRQAPTSSMNARGPRRCARACAGSTPDRPRGDDSAARRRRRSGGSGPPAGAGCGQAGSMPMPRQPPCSHRSARNSPLPQPISTTFLPCSR